MDSGVLIMILIFFFAFLCACLGFYCHLCVGTQANLTFGSNSNLPTVMYAKKRTPGDPTEHNCKCSNKFKGRCGSCEGDNFVDDGELGSPRDFSNFGGDRGFDFSGSGGNDGDPMRGFLGNGSAPTGTSRLDQPDHNVSSYGTTPDQY